MKSNNGGPAFPVPVVATPDGSVYHSMEVGGSALGGMTLRDYFAAKAMQSIVSLLYAGIRASDLGNMARDAYVIADAMLKAREAA